VITAKRSFFYLLYVNPKKDSGHLGEEKVIHVVIAVAAQTLKLSLSISLLISHKSPKADKGRARYLLVTFHANYNCSSVPRTLIPKFHEAAMEA